MKFLLRVMLKALLLFALANVLFAALPGLRLGRISAYNTLVPGRPRFPFGETPQQAYSFSLFDLDAMFAAHRYSARPPTGDFRVVVIGDSSVWGTLLRPEETLAGQLDALALAAPDGRRMRFFNLGYPTISVTKDLLILDRALAYQPDMVIWLTTLEALPREKQLAVPLVENNPAAAADVIDRYGLALDPARPPGFGQRTLIGQRKNLADLFRLQVYGIPWAATGIDQLYPSDYPRAQVDLEADPTYGGRETLAREDLAFDVLRAAAARVDVPLLLVNEPILISTGANSDVRYNFYYPRRAYDDYRAWLAEEAEAAGIAYLDAWDIVPPEEFTNSAIHLNAEGTARLVEAITNWIGR